MGARRLDVDVAKAVGVVAVVAIHSRRSFFSPEISRGELWLGAVLQFAVPGVFVAPGVLAATARPVPPRLWAPAPCAFDPLVLVAAGRRLLGPRSRTVLGS
jgi:hypothetical protein